MRSIISFTPYKGSQHFFEIDANFSLQLMKLIPFFNGKIRRFKTDELKGIVFDLNIEWLFLRRLELKLRLAIKTQNKPEQK